MTAGDLRKNLELLKCAAGGLGTQTDAVLCSTVMAASDGKLTIRIPQSLGLNSVLSIEALLSVTKGIRSEAELTFEPTPAGSDAPIQIKSGRFKATLATKDIPPGEFRGTENNCDWSNPDPTLIGTLRHSLSAMNKGDDKPQYASAYVQPHEVWSSNGFRIFKQAIPNVATPASIPGAFINLIFGHKLLEAVRSIHFGVDYVAALCGGELNKPETQIFVASTYTSTPFQEGWRQMLPTDESILTWIHLPLTDEVKDLLNRLTTYGTAAQFTLKDGTLIANCASEMVKIEDAVSVEGDGAFAVTVRPEHLLWGLEVSPRLAIVADRFPRMVFGSVGSDTRGLTSILA